MQIDNNELELESMKMFKSGDKVRAHELEDKFIEQFRESKRRGEDHCSCTVKTCKHHGRCMDCIAIHRGHRDHLPNCLHSMANEKLKSLVSLTESKLDEPKR